MANKTPSVDIQRQTNAASSLEWVKFPRDLIGSGKTLGTIRIVVRLWRLSIKIPFDSHMLQKSGQSTWKVQEVEARCRQDTGFL